MHMPYINLIESSRYIWRLVAEMLCLKLQEAKSLFCGDDLLAEIGSLPKYIKLLAFEFLLQGSVLSLLVSLCPN